MALIIRIDVDRPYGRSPLWRHLASRISSDLYFPRVRAFGYLAELIWMLELLAAADARALVFFRRCTFPTDEVKKLLEAGSHEPALHLENSRSPATCQEELDQLNQILERNITAVSKHGSGSRRFGLRHYPPYEPHRYLDWMNQSGVRLFLGNLEDPRLLPERHGDVVFYPAAFWLEPAWRDESRFPLQWLRTEAEQRDVVLLVHPENVRASPSLASAFADLVNSIPSVLPK